MLSRDEIYSVKQDAIHELHRKTFSKRTQKGSITLDVFYLLKQNGPDEVNVPILQTILRMQLKFIVLSFNCFIPIDHLNLLKIPCVLYAIVTWCHLNLTRLLLVKQFTRLHPCVIPHTVVHVTMYPTFPDYHLQTLHQNVFSHQHQSFFRIFARVCQELILPSMSIARLCMETQVLEEKNQRKYVPFRETSEYPLSSLEHLLYVNKIQTLSFNRVVI